MSFKVELLAENDLCVVAYLGQVTSRDFENLWHTLSSMPDYRFDIDGVALMGEDADLSGVTYEICRMLARNYVMGHRAMPERRAKRTAFICATDMQRALMKMFAAYVNTNGPSHMQVACFDTLDQALDWIEPCKGTSRTFDRRRIKDVCEALGQGWCFKNNAAA